MRIRWERELVLAALLVGAAGNAAAATITFEDFSSTAGLTLSGDAATVTTGDGTVLRLVPADFGQSGSAFSSATINASNFSTAFEFRLTDAGGFCCDASGHVGADGFVFVIQNVSSSIGGGGGGMGYAGITPSVGVEFDTWHNAEVGDLSTNHLGVDVNGSVTSNIQQVVAPAFDNGQLWTAWIDYNGSLLEVRTNTTGIRPLLPNLSYVIDIAAILGTNTAFVGFTAGTGADFANHDIVSWTYSDEFRQGGVDPGITPIPEPGTLTLLGMGTAGLIARMRRRRA